MKSDKQQIGWMKTWGCTKTWHQPAVYVQDGGGGVLGSWCRKKSRRGPLMWQQRGCSNNDVVLELWTGMLAGLLRVYASAAGRLHSMTDIKLSLPKCNNGISFQREGRDMGQSRKKEEGGRTFRQLFAVLFNRNSHQKCSFSVEIRQNLKNRAPFLHYVCIFVHFLLFLYIWIAKTERMPTPFVHTHNTDIWKCNQELATLHITRKEKKGHNRRGEEWKWVRLCVVVCLKKCPSAMIVGADGACNGRSVHRNKLGSGWSIANRVQTFPQSSSQDKRWGRGEVGTEIFEEQKKE